MKFQEFHIFPRKQIQRRYKLVEDNAAVHQWHVYMWNKKKDPVFFVFFFFLNCKKTLSKSSVFIYLFSREASIGNKINPSNVDDPSA
jgi:hypothetical protein